MRSSISTYLALSPLFLSSLFVFVGVDFHAPNQVEAQRARARIDVRRTGRSRGGRVRARGRSRRGGATVSVRPRGRGYARSAPPRARVRTRPAPAPVYGPPAPPVIYVTPPPVVYPEPPVMVIPAPAPAPVVYAPAPAPAPAPVVYGPAPAAPNAASHSAGARPMGSELRPAPGCACPSGARDCLAPAPGPLVHTEGRGTVEIEVVADTSARVEMVESGVIDTEGRVIDVGSDLGSIELVGPGGMSSERSTSCSHVCSANPAVRSRPTLGMLHSEAGVSVEGERTRLADLGPLRIHARVQAQLEAGARLDLGPEVDATATIADPLILEETGEGDLVVNVQGNDVNPGARTRLSVHIVVDRSSSMHTSWPEVQASIRTVLSQLDPSDSVQIIAYGSEAAEVLPPTTVGTRARLDARVRDISVGGGTNIEAGLRLAYQTAARVPPSQRAVVLLLSDGVPNRGAFDGAELAPVVQEAAAQGCTTTAIGLGHQFDAALLQAVAQAGGGHYHVARNHRQLGPALQAELAAQQRLAARDVRVNIRLNANVVLPTLPEGWVRTSTGIQLRLPSLAAGETRRIVARVQVRAPLGGRPIAQVGVEYRGHHGVRRAEKPIYNTPAQQPALLAARFASMDHNLSVAMEQAAQHVLRGQAALAEQALRGHVAFCARVQTGHPGATHRTAAVDRFARALRSTVRRASHRERRVMALEMGALSVALGR